MDNLWIFLSVVAWLISAVEMAIVMKSWGRKSSNKITHAALWMVVAAIFVFSAGSDAVDNIIPAVTGILMIAQGILWEINYKLTKKNQAAEEQQ